MMTAAIIPVPPSPSASQTQTPRDTPTPSQTGNASADSPFQQIVSSLTNNRNPGTDRGSTQSTAGTAASLPKRPGQQKSPQSNDAPNPSGVAPSQPIVAAADQSVVAPNDIAQSTPASKSIGSSETTPAVMPSEAPALVGAIVTPITAKGLAQIPPNVDTQTNTTNSTPRTNKPSAEVAEVIPHVVPSPDATTQAAGASEIPASEINTAAMALPTKLLGSPKTETNDAAAAVVKTYQPSPANVTDLGAAGTVGHPIAPPSDGASGQASAEESRRSGANEVADQPAVIHAAASINASWLAASAGPSVANMASGQPDGLAFRNVQPGSVAGNGMAGAGEPLLGSTSPNATAVQSADVSWPDLVRGVASAAPGRLERDGQAEFRFRVTPPDMGEINVRLVSGRNGVTGELTVGTSVVQQLVQSRLPELRQQLEAAGVAVNSFHVTHQGGSSPDSRRQHPAAWSSEGPDPLQPIGIAGRTHVPAPSRGLVDVTA
jgi:flagellar hook-length control protein FliK